MVYRAIGVVNDREKNGLQLVFAELQENAGSWTITVLAKKEEIFPAEWQERLEKIETTAVTDYLALHHSFGRFIGEAVQTFITENGLDFKVQLIGMLGYPVNAAAAELGSGAAVAAITGINTVDGFNAVNHALGGNGADLFAITRQLLPETVTDEFSAALQVALLAVLRWREENNSSAAATGASRDCIGGAVWIGQEA
jgi:anhydro-N-acetylmuramic acid kinase